VTQIVGVGVVMIYTKIAQVEDPIFVQVSLLQMTCHHFLLVLMPFLQEQQKYYHKAPIQTFAFALERQMMDYSVPSRFNYQC
jgi:hypothetical protein